MSEAILRIEPSPRAKIAQHAFAALTLIVFALDHLSRPHAGIPLLAIVEIAAALLLVVAMVRERRQKSHGGVAWVELAGALMAFVEALERTQGRHHVSFIILSYFAPVLLLAFALLDARISPLHYLKADDEAFIVRKRIFFPSRVRWADVSAFRIFRNAIECELARGGKRRFSLRNVKGRQNALAWSAEQFRLRGIPESAE